MNDTTNHTGNGYGGGPSGLFATGTANGASSGLTVNVTHSGTWSTNQWAGIRLRGRPTLEESFNAYLCRDSIQHIHTITYTRQRQLRHSWRSQFHERRFIGDLQSYSGARSTGSELGRRPSSSRWPSPTPPAGWNDQITTPCYSWNNTQVTGPNANFSPDVKIIRSGEHYYNETSMPGYTEYTYPHPLVTGGTPTPDAVPDGHAAFAAAASHGVATVMFGHLAQLTSSAHGFALPSAEGFHQALN